MNLFNRKKVKKIKAIDQEQLQEQLKQADEFGKQIDNFLQSSPRPISVIGKQAQELVERNFQNNVEGELIPTENKWSGGYSYTENDYKKEEDNSSGWVYDNPAATQSIWNDSNFQQNKSGWKNSNVGYQIQNLDCGFPYIIIDNFYSKEEEDLVWDEIKFLSGNNKLFASETTGGAIESGSSGNLQLKKNKGIFLHECYNSQSISNILEFNKKFRDITYTHDHWYFEPLCSNEYKGKVRTCNIGKDGALLSYYENSDYYKTHLDVGYVTTLIWIYREPKKFEGGELFFPKFNKTIELKNNRVIIFPSVAAHEVKGVKMNEEDMNKGLGRYVITNFTRDI